MWSQTVRQRNTKNNRELIKVRGKSNANVPSTRTHQNANQDEKYKTNKTKGIIIRGRIQMTQEHVLSEEEQMTAARTKRNKPG